MEKMGISEIGIGGSSEVAALPTSRDPADFADLVVNGGLSGVPIGGCLETAVNHKKGDAEPMGDRRTPSALTLS
jgi:hypothetical protein